MENDSPSVEDRSLEDRPLFPLRIGPLPRILDKRYLEQAEQCERHLADGDNAD